MKWSRNCILVADTAANQNPTFQIDDTKIYVSVVTLSTQENTKLLNQLESGFKRTINWNKYLAKTKNKAQNSYLYFAIDPSFQGVNRVSALSFKDDDGRESHKQYYLSTVKIKDYHVMSNGRTFLIKQLKMI